MFLINANVGSSVDHLMSLWIKGNGVTMLFIFRDKNFIIYHSAGSMAFQLAGGSKGLLIERSKESLPQSLFLKDTSIRLSNAWQRPDQQE